MRLNSDRALEIGRQLYERYNGDWSRVRAAGVTRPDGVVDLTREPVTRAGETVARVEPQGRRLTRNR